MKPMNHEEGILLIGTGEKYRSEAITCAPLLRPFINGRPIVLVTDKPNSVPLNIFDQVLQHPYPQKSYRDKIEPLIQLPFKYTLFLDTDLELIQPIDDIFAILHQLDFVGCHAPVRWCQWKDPSVPEGFCEINSGVLGLRRSRRVKALIKRWLVTYDLAEVSFDQASLRSALWWASKKLNLRSWVLPPEYNLRTPKPWLVGPGICVKIIHGRVDSELKEPLKQYLNNDINTFRSSSSFPTGQNQAILPYQPIPNNNK